MPRPGRGGPANCMAGRYGWSWCTARARRYASATLRFLCCPRAHRDHERQQQRQRLVHRPAKQDGQHRDDGHTLQEEAAGRAPRMQGQPQEGGADAAAVDGRHAGKGVVRASFQGEQAPKQPAAGTQQEECGLEATSRQLGDQKLWVRLLPFLPVQRLPGVVCVHGKAACCVSQMSPLRRRPKVLRCCRDHTVAVACFACVLNGQLWKSRIFSPHVTK